MGAISAGRGADLDGRSGPAGGLYHSRSCRRRRAREPQSDRPRGPRAGRSRARRRRRAALRTSGPTRIRSARAGRSRLVESRSPMPRGSSATPTATSRCTRSPTRFLAPPRWAISGRAFPADCANARRHRERRNCCAAVVERLAVAGLRPRVRGPHDRRRAAAPRRPPRRDADRDRGPPRRSTPERVSVKASTGNLAGAEGAGRAVSAQAIAVVEPSPMTLRLLDTLHRRAAPVRAAATRTTSASTRAARRSTARPTSAISARSSSPTSLCATCATRASTSAG